MPRPGGHDLLDQRRDIACPQCSYNLRGHDGPIITCPECGQTVDLVTLLVQRREDWWGSPIYRHLLIAAVVLWPALVALLVALVAPVYGYRIAATGAGIVCFAVWGALCRRAYAPRLDLEMIRLITLSHLLVLLFFVHLLAISLVPFVAFLWLILTAPWLTLSMPLLVLLCASAWIALAFGLPPLLWRLDRHLGRACVRRDLEAPER